MIACSARHTAPGAEGARAGRGDETDDMCRKNGRIDEARQGPPDCRKKPELQSSREPSARIVTILYYKSRFTNQ